MGANFKVVYRNVGDFAQSWGGGLDISAIYKKGSKVFNEKFGTSKRKFFAAIGEIIHE